MYQVRGRGWPEWKLHYVCATYRKIKGGCDSHRIPNVVAEEMLFDSIRKLVSYVREHEDEFVEQVMQKSKKESERSLRSAKKELEQGNARIKKLDEIIQRLYEDNISGKISDERFAKMTANYEEEQKTLESRIKELTSIIAASSGDSANVQEFIEKVYVHKMERVDGKRVYRIRIIWNCIGEIRIPDVVTEEKTA